MNIKNLATLAVVLVGVGTAGCGSSATKTPAANSTDMAFVNQMIPHHRSAVEMARIAQSRAQHPQLKQLAANIIESQNAEINLMTGLRRQFASSGSAHSMTMTGSGAMGMSQEQMGMNMDPSVLKTAQPFDRAFLTMMVPHHGGAVLMARQELKVGRNPQLRALAGRIIAAQNKEIAEMTAWKHGWYPGSGALSGG